MIYTEKKNPIYDTKTSSKPHTPYAIQMEVGRLKRVEVTDGWQAAFMAAQRSQRGIAGLLTLFAVHFLRHGKSSLQGENRQTERQMDTHTHKIYLVTLLKPSLTVFASLLFLALELLLLCSLYISSFLLNINIRPVGNEAIEDQLSFACVE